MTRLGTEGTRCRTHAKGAITWSGAPHRQHRANKAYTHIHLALQYADIVIDDDDIVLRSLNACNACCIQTPIVRVL